MSDVRPASLRAPRPQTLLLGLIVLLQILYSAFFIARSSFVIAGERYFVLFDDAMISMRYARNLAAGFGPVWNPGGPRVEGITNPLWMLYMALVHLLPVPASKMSLPIQITGALLLTLNVLVVKRLADLLGRGSAFVSLTAAALTAFYFPMNIWGLLGMEVSLVLLLVSVATLWALRCLQAGRFSPWPYLLLGVATLARLDALVILLVMGLFLALADAPHRWRHLAAVALTVALFIGGQTLLRWWYYGDLLPNTYYLKMTGFPLPLRLSRGLYVSRLFLSGLGWPLVLLGLLALLRRFERGLLLLLGMVVAQVAYSMYVGGDAWESWGGCNRFVGVVMPLFFVLLAASLGMFWRRAPLLALLIVLVAGYRFNTTTVSLHDWVLVENIPHMAPHSKLVRMSLLLRDTTGPDARVAVVTAGIVPYFAERDTLDLLGKNDPLIAHSAAHLMPGMPPFIAFYPGHNKWDYAYSIGELQPDVVAQVWAAPEEAAPYLASSYRTVDIQGLTLYYLGRSKAVLWEKIDQINHERHAPRNNGMPALWGD